MEARMASHDHRTHDAESVHWAKIGSVMLLTNVVTVVAFRPFLVLVTFVRPITAFPSFVAATVFVPFMDVVPNAVLVPLLGFVPNVVFVPLMDFLQDAVFVMAPVVAVIAVLMPVAPALVLVLARVLFVPGIAIVIVLGKGRHTDSHG
jgi:hypothetical protein